MQNLIVISFDISSKNLDSSSGENIDFERAKAEVDKLTEIALPYLNQYERVLLKNANGADVFYLGPAKEALLVATKFRDDIVANNLDATEPLFLRVGIHVEKVNASENNQVAPLIIRNASQRAKLLKNNAKSNEIVVSRSYLEDAPSTMQTMVRVYDLPIPASETEFDKRDIVSNQVKKRRIRKRSDESASAKNNSAEFPLLSLESTPIFESLVAEKRTSVTHSKKLNCFYIALSVCACLALFLLYQAKFSPANLNKHYASSNPPLAENSEHKAKQPEQVLLPVNEPDEKSDQKKTPITENAATKQPKSRDKTFWNKLVSNFKQGKRLECTQVEVALKQCAK